MTYKHVNSEKIEVLSSISQFIDERLQDLF